MTGHSKKSLFNKGDIGKVERIDVDQILVQKLQVYQIYTSTVPIGMILPSLEPKPT